MALIILRFFFFLAFALFFPAQISAAASSGNGPFGVTVKQGRISFLSPFKLRSISATTSSRPRVYARITAPFPYASFIKDSDTFPITASEAGIFDIWREIEAHDVERGKIARLDFVLPSDIPRRVCLGIGASDQCVVTVNGTIVFSLAGRRDLRVDQNLVPINLNPGDNNISVISLKHEEWTTIPRKHFDDEWAVKLRVYDDVDQAIKQASIWNYHPLDLPIIENLQDMRVDCITEQSSVSVFALDGSLRASGNVSPDGSIVWTESNIPEPLFIGYAVLNAQVGEPIIITNGNNLASISFPKSNSQKTSAWHKRLSILLSNQDRNDAWWQRKLAAAACMVAFTDTESKHRAQRACKALCFDFIEYISKVDGSRQYCMIYEPSREPALETDANKVAVILPTVATETHPFLQAVVVASLKELETLGSLSEASQVTLLWPGYTDVDYGGDFAGTVIAESITAFRRHKERASKFFIVGTCSSGVAAMHFTETHASNVSGVVLHSPFVRRRLHKWLPQSTERTLRFPAELLRQEDPGSALATLSKREVLIVFDSDMAGHGDRGGSIELRDNLQKLHGRVTFLTPGSTDEFLFGERYRMRAATWMDWIAQCPASSTDDSFTRPSITTIKASLLQGFSLGREDPTSQVMSAWQHDFCLYRGEGLPHERADRTAPSLITYSSFRRDELINWYRLQNEAYKPMLAKTSDALTEGVYVGASLDILPKEGAYRINIFSTKDAPIESGFDPLLDGCCAAVLLRLTDNTWHIEQLWTK